MAINYARIYLIHNDEKGGDIAMAGWIIIADWIAVTKHLEMKWKSWETDKQT